MTSCHLHILRGEPAWDHQQGLWRFLRASILAMFPPSQMFAYRVNSGSQVGSQPTSHVHLLLPPPLLLVHFSLPLPVIIRPRQALWRSKWSLYRVHDGGVGTLICMLYYILRITHLRASDDALSSHSGEQNGRP